MGCCGKHVARSPEGFPDVPRKVLPTDECVLCSEKHLATAYSLAQEGFYDGENRLRIVGELVLAQWHVFHVESTVAGMMRDLRHLVQQRREKEAQWNPVVVKMSELVEKELANMKKETP